MVARGPSLVGTPNWEVPGALGLIGWEPLSGSVSCIFSCQPL